MLTDRNLLYRGLTLRTCAAVVGIPHYARGHTVRNGGVALAADTSVVEYDLALPQRLRPFVGGSEGPCGYGVCKTSGSGGARFDPELSALGT